MGVATTGEQEMRLITPAEAAEYLHLSTAQVYKMVRSGELPAKKIGHVWRISPRALRDFVGLD